MTFRVNDRVKFKRPVNTIPVSIYTVIKIDSKGYLQLNPEYTGFFNPELLELVSRISNKGSVWLKTDLP